MSAHPLKVFGSDPIHNDAVVRWISRRMREIRLHQASPLPPSPGMDIRSKDDAQSNWDHLEHWWSEKPNATDVLEAMNRWIELYLPPGRHEAGKERQKMLMSIRSLKAGRRRRQAGAVRFELDMDLSNRIAECCKPLHEIMTESSPGGLLRYRNEALHHFVRHAVELVLNDPALVAQVNELAAVDANRVRY